MPETKLFTLVGQGVLLHFKYKGIRITTYWIVNDTDNLSNISYIQSTVQSFSNNTVCEEVQNLELLRVTHNYSGNYTAYACRGAYNDSAPHHTVNLS